MNEYAVSTAKCIAYAATLTADDARFNQDIEVRHQDGSLWYMRCAFWMIDPDDDKFVWVITEHFKEMIFEAEDVGIKLFPAGPAVDYLRTAE